MSGGGAEGGREHPAWNLTRGLNSQPWDRDLSQNQESDAQLTEPPRSPPDHVIFSDVGFMSLESTQANHKNIPKPEGTLRFSILGALAGVQLTQPTASPFQTSQPCAQRQIQDFTADFSPRGTGDTSCLFCSSVSHGLVLWQSPCLRNRGSWNLIEFLRRKTKCALTFSLRIHFHSP